MNGLDDIVEEFLVESSENLDHLTADLVALEQEPDSRELLSSIFRTLHTIKGTSGFLAFHRLEEVTHAGENLLSRLRDGDLGVTAHRTSVLLSMVDTVRDLLASIATSGGEGPVEVAGVVSSLGAAMEDTAAGVESPAPAAAPAPAAKRAPAAKTPNRRAPARKAPARKAPARAGAKKAPAAKAPAAKAPAAKVPAAKDLAAASTVVEVPTQPMQPVARPDRGAVPADSNGAPRRAAGGGNTIRVDVHVLDGLMRLVSELVLTRNRIVQSVARYSDTDLVRASQRLNLIAGELQEGVMKTRVQPIDHIWSTLPRVVRDLALTCGKTVRLELEGRETELDKTLLEAVKDPLTHLVRNAVDHGIELPDARRAAGKPTEGLLTLRARHESGQVVVEVSDDGAGIDPVTIGARAVECGLITPAALSRLSRQDVLQLISRPGFSTAAAVTNVSGRGVGMDVVRTDIEAIGGTVEVDSQAGRGTCVRLRIPLTLAVVPALTVECAGERYAIPQTSLEELVALDAGKAGALEEVGGAPVHRLRGELLPLVRLADVLEVGSDRHEGRCVMAVLRYEGRRFGLAVDRVLDTEEVVVTPLGGVLESLDMYSGATVLGDGAIALVLDVQALARRALRPETTDRQESRAAASSVALPDTERRPMLLAATGGGRRIAIPLDTVTRLEQIRVEAVERVGNREVVQYRGDVLPIIRLDRHPGAHGMTDRGVLEVIVHADGGRSAAIVVDEILDIVDGGPAVRSDIDGPGLPGVAVLADQVTELLDVRAAILAADPAFYSTRPRPLPSAATVLDSTPMSLLEV